MILIALAAAALAFYLLPIVISAVIHAMPAAQLLGHRETDRDFPTRVRAVTKFMAGLADGISGYDPARRRRYRSLTSFEKPFYVEGACAGLRLAQYMAPWRAIPNLKKFQARHERHLFLLTIGTGFAAGLETFWTSSVTSHAMKMSRQVDLRLQQMFFDGYAFQKVIFNYLKRPGMLAGGLPLEAMARHGFYEGVGRALWFLAPDFAGLQTAIAALPADCIAECHTGYGIASGFAGVEIVAADDPARYLPGQLASADFQTGLIVGLFGRYYTEPEYVEQLLGGRQAQLLAQVRRAAALFDELWLKNVGYEDWRSALRLQLAQETTGRGHARQPAASMV